jgi:hypothetical protein
MVSGVAGVGREYALRIGWALGYSTAARTTTVTDGDGLHESVRRLYAAVQPLVGKTVAVASAQPCQPSAGRCDARDAQRCTELQMHAVVSPMANTVPGKGRCGITLRRAVIGHRNRNQGR